MWLLEYVLYHNMSDIMIIYNNASRIGGDFPQYLMWTHEIAMYDDTAMQGCSSFCIPRDP